LSWLQCSDEGCKKWRRVDFQAIEAFSNAFWFSIASPAEVRKRVGPNPQLEAYITDWLQRKYGRPEDRRATVCVLNETDYTELRETMRIQDDGSFERVLLVVFLFVARADKFDISQTLWIARKRVGMIWVDLAFGVACLFDTTCDERCDFERLLSQPCYLDENAAFDGEEVFVMPVDDGDSPTGDVMFVLNLV
jgi:hypothetical protein